METLVIKQISEKFVFFCKLGGIFQNKKNGNVWNQAWSAFHGVYVSNICSMETSVIER